MLGYIECSFWIQLIVKYIKATDNISHLNNRNFFKYWFTSSLGQGRRAMQVAIFSGCSSHSMWSMFFCCSVSASSFRVVSPGAYKEQNTEHRTAHLGSAKRQWEKYGEGLLITESGVTVLPKRELQSMFPEFFLAPFAIHSRSVGPQKSSLGVEGGGIGRRGGV